MKRYLVTDYGVAENSAALQTERLQAVLDLCRGEGGTVVIPKGRFYTAALYLHSDTTLYLEAGAELYGSACCDDYAVFPIPPGLEMRSDMEMIPQYYGGRLFANYRRAILSSYGEENISVIGEAGAVIDGVNCYDPDGEEGYRGPHAIFLSCCRNVRLEGYTVRHSGNFLHEANHCRDLTMRRVTCLGGSDGIHLHCSEHTLIEDCLFKTGDDCIAGVNIKDLTVRRCVLNTSCNLFRIGGVGITVEDVYAYGPGYYPHRRTVVKGRGEELARSEGRHNTLYLVDYFASTEYLFSPSDITFRRCVIENADAILAYRADSNVLQRGTRLGHFLLEDVRFSGLRRASAPCGTAEVPLHLTLSGVVTEPAEGVDLPTAFELAEDAHVILTEE